MKVDLPAFVCVYEQSLLAERGANRAPEAVLSEEPWQASRRRPACAEWYNFHQSQWFAMV